MISWDGNFHILYHFVPFCPTLTFRPVYGLPDSHTVSPNRPGAVWQEQALNIWYGGVMRLGKGQMSSVIQIRRPRPCYPGHALGTSLTTPVEPQGRLSAICVKRRWPVPPTGSMSCPCHGPRSLPREDGLRGSVRKCRSRNRRTVRNWRPP